MEKTINAAIEFARKHGMVVEEVGDRRLRVAYPSGEHQVLNRDNIETPRIITNMTCRML